MLVEIDWDAQAVNHHFDPQDWDTQAQNDGFSPLDLHAQAVNHYLYP